MFVITFSGIFNDLHAQSSWDDQKFSDQIDREVALIKRNLPIVGERYNIIEANRIGSRELRFFLKSNNSSSAQDQIDAVEEKRLRAKYVEEFCSLSFFHSNGGIVSYQHLKSDGSNSLLVIASSQDCIKKPKQKYATHEACLAASNKINEMLPRLRDKNTRVVSSFCRPQTQNSPQTFVSNIEFLPPKGTKNIDEEFLEQLREVFSSEKQKNIFKEYNCSRPRARNMFHLAPRISETYSTSDKRYIGEIYIDESNCGSDRDKILKMHPEYPNL